MTTEEKEELEEVLISRSQYRALNEIHGLHEDAHYMVMCAKGYSNGFVLKGKQKSFDALVRDLHDEVNYIAPKTRAKTLQALIRKLEPEYEDF